MKTTKFWIGILAVGVCLLGNAAEKGKAATGSYKDALRKAGEAGKPLLLEFYTDWCPYCKELDANLKGIPATVNKFVLYRVNIDTNAALAKQFDVKSPPTVFFLTPDGKEVDRWGGSPQGGKDAVRDRLENILKNVGPLETKPKVKTPQSAAVETAASSKLKSAEMYVKVNKKKDAEKLLKEILDKYPDTDAATQAQADLDTLNGADSTKK